MVLEVHPMIPVLEEQSHNPWKAFGRGFVEGLGSIGNFVVLRQSGHVRRCAGFETPRRDRPTDWEMIHRDFNKAFCNLNERTEER
jgi:hypothetical protein